MSSSAASNSIDFDFFDNVGCQSKLYGKHKKQSDSSTIITKAVIETAPDLSDFHGNTNDKHSGHSKHFEVATEEIISQYYRKSECLSSPSSSVERALLGLDDAALVNLMNCLAYNDDERFDSRVSLSPSSFDLKESSDNSLSDSTVTTITSDFTSISPLSSSSLSNSSCDSIPNDHNENSAASGSNLDSERPTDLCALVEDFKQEKSNTNDEVLDELKENYELSSLRGSASECDDSSEKQLSIHDENSNSTEPYESDFESFNETKYLDKNCENGEIAVRNGEFDSVSDKESHVSTLGDELGDTSITQSRSSSVKTSYKKRKNCNLTFSREELIRIERDNLILLKKIMAHSKHKPVSLNQQPLSHKKSSTAINRAKQQKKIEQDNYILYSKISAMSRLKKVF